MVYIYMEETFVAIEEIHCAFFHVAFGYDISFRITMLLSILGSFLLGSTILLATTSASDITSFTDARCMHSWHAVDTVNGYPDGLCKPLNVTRGQSFQIQKLDSGCAGDDFRGSCSLHLTDPLQ